MIFPTRTLAGKAKPGAASTAEARQNERIERIRAFLDRTKTYDGMLVEEIREDGAPERFVVTDLIGSTLYLRRFATFEPQERHGSNEPEPFPFRHVFAPPEGWIFPHLVKPAKAVLRMTPATHEKRNRLRAFIDERLAANGRSQSPHGELWCLEAISKPALEFERLYYSR